MVLRGSRRAAWLLLAWCLAKSCTAVIRPMLTYQVLKEQVAAMPDPTTPLYTIQSIEAGTWLGMVILFGIRMALILVVGVLAVIALSAARAPDEPRA